MSYLQNLEHAQPPSARLVLVSRAGTFFLASWRPPMGSSDPLGTWIAPDRGRHSADALPAQLDDYWAPLDVTVPPSDLEVVIGPDDDEGNWGGSLEGESPVDRARAVADAMRDARHQAGRKAAEGLEEQARAQVRAIVEEVLEERNRDVDEGPVEPDEDLEVVTFGAVEELADEAEVPVEALGSPPDLEAPEESVPGAVVADWPKLPEPGRFAPVLQAVPRTAGRRYLVSVPVRPTGSPRQRWTYLLPIGYVVLRAPSEHWEAFTEGTPGSTWAAQVRAAGFPTVEAAAGALAGRWLAVSADADRAAGQHVRSDAR